MKNRSISPFLIFFILFLSAEYINSAQAVRCGAGKRSLFFVADSTFYQHTPSGFAERIFNQLKQPLEEIGYCITLFDTVFLYDSGMAEELVMVLSMIPAASGSNGLLPMKSSQNEFIPDSEFLTTNSLVTIVTLLQVKSWSEKQLQQAAETPLLSLAYKPDELTTFESVLTRKIVENLRMQYICHLRIQSIPENVLIRSDRGLEGRTPLEWIIPLGKIVIRGESEGYEPVHRKIDLAVPGIHTYVFEMSKRRFYHSHFFIPTLVLGASSVTCFALERYYYNKYSNLGREDRGKVPDPFERNFTIAKNFERASAVTLTLGVLTLTLCFFF